MGISKEIIKKLKVLSSDKQHILQNLEDEYRQKLVDLLMGELDLPESSPLVHTFFIIGFTPEWNDGEECFHQTWIPCAYDDIMEEIYGTEMVDDPEFRRQYGLIENIFKDDKFSDQLELLLGTNWKLTFHFHNGKFHGVVVDHYDCQY